MDESVKPAPPGPDVVTDLAEHRQGEVPIAVPRGTEQVIARPDEDVDKVRERSSPHVGGRVVHRRDGRAVAHALVEHDLIEAVTAAGELGCAQDVTSCDQSAVRVHLRPEGGSTGGTLRAGRARRPCRAGLAFGSLQALDPLRTLCAGLPLLPFLSLGASLDQAGLGRPVRPVRPSPPSRPCLPAVPVGPVLLEYLADSTGTACSSSGTEAPPPL